MLSCYCSLCSCFFVASQLHPPPATRATAHCAPHCCLCSRPAVSSFASGSTALMVAARTGMTEAVDALTSHAPEVAIDAVDRHGSTALALAVSGGHVAAVDALLNAGANMEAVDSEGEAPHPCADSRDCPCV